MAVIKLCLTCNPETRHAVVGLGLDAVGVLLNPDQAVSLAGALVFAAEQAASRSAEVRTAPFKPLGLWRILRCLYRGYINISPLIVEESDLA